MGDGHHRAREALQELLQPVHRFGIQVVGGFIEQQHVGLGQQQAAQCHAALFTAGELRDHGLPGRQAQGVGSDFQQVVATVTRGRDDGFELGLFGREGVEVGVFLGIGRIHLFQARLGGIDLAHAAFDCLTHVLVRVELRLLGQVSDLQARHRSGFAFDFLVDAGHDLEQRRLARAIETEHTDLGAGEEAQGNVLEDLSLGRHDLADPIHGENVLGHGSDGSGRKRRLSGHATMRA